MPRLLVEKKSMKAPKPLNDKYPGQIALFAEPVVETPSPAPPSVSTKPIHRVPDIGAEQIEQLNELIMAQYDMALYERRIFVKMLEMLPETIQEPLPGATGLVALFVPIEVDAREIIADSDLKGESAFEELKKATKNLIRHVCHIAEADGLLQVGLMSSAKYLKGKGKISISVDPRLHPYLLKVRQHFSLDTLRALIKFRSYYSQCFYEWFDQSKASGRTTPISISLVALRKMLGIGEKEYERYYDLKRFVIGQAQKELKGTEFEFQFKEKRAGRTVIGFEYYLPWTRFAT